MSTQNAGTMKQTEIDKLKKTIKEYKDENKKLRKQLNDKNKLYNKLLFYYMTDKYITSYKHIKSNEYADFDNFITQYKSLFGKHDRLLTLSAISLNLVTLTKYITDYFNRDVILNWIYKKVYIRFFQEYRADKSTNLKTIIEEFYKNDSSVFGWPLISGLINGLILSLIKFYMTTSEKETYLKIIQNYFPGFDYLGTEDIHKTFWETEYDKISDCAREVSITEFINKCIDNDKDYSDSSDDNYNCSGYSDYSDDDE